VGSSVLNMRRKT